MHEPLGLQTCEISRNNILWYYPTSTEYTVCIQCSVYYTPTKYISKHFQKLECSIFQEKKSDHIGNRCKNHHIRCAS